MTNDETRATTASNPIEKLLSDIKSERERIAKSTLDAEQLKMELSGTVLDLLEDAVKRFKEELARGQKWAFEYMKTLSDHVQSHDDRIDLLEDLGGAGGTTILVEDAEVLSKVAVAAKSLAAVLMQGPFPINEQDEDGKAKLIEVIALAEQAEQIIADNTLSDEDEEGEEGEEDESELEQN